MLVSLMSVNLSLIIGTTSVFKSSKNVDHFVNDSDKIEIFSKVKGGIQAITISNNGFYLAAATTIGLIAVVSLKTTVPE
jgi:hypothetical protein